MPDDPGPDGDELLVEVTDGVGRLTINRPERRNAMSWSVLTGMREQLAAWKHDPGVRVVVLTGSGDKAFCAGADLTGMAGDAGALELHESRGELARLFHDLWDLGKPTVARVRGYCLAGGFGLALSCDLVVAADDAQFGTPEIDVGLWPYMITIPLVRSMPPKKVLELIRRLRDQGVPVILITHTLPDVFAVADRLMVMHRGRKVTEKKTADTNTEELVQYMVGARDDTLHEPGLPR